MFSQNFLEKFLDVLRFLSSPVRKLFDIYRALWKELAEDCIHSKISYCTITIWNFRSINFFFILSPDMIILCFHKYCNVPLNHYFIESVQFLTFTESLFIFWFLNLSPFSSIMLSSSTRFPGVSHAKYVLHCSINKQNHLSIVQLLYIFLALPLQ